MDIQTILERYNPWWYKKYDSIGIKRNIYLKLLEENLKNKQTIFITGLRRVGKTTLIKQFITRLIERGIYAEKIFFAPFDDPSLSSIKIDELVDEFRKLNSLKFEEKIYLFFDEISYKDNFSQELKVLHDNQNVKIYASGSNSLKLMDTKAFLTGRTFTIRIEPLNFEEFLEFNKIKISPLDKQLKDKYFEEYLKMGGMPEYVLTKNPEFLSSLVEDIIYKDIARTFKIKNVNKLREVFILLCERVGKRLTYNKLSEVLQMDNETTEEYVSYFQKTFLFNIVQRYSKSLNERVKSPKKIYIADNGIRNIFVGYKDKGSLFENYVLNEILKKFKEIFYYYENNHEIDFIVKKNLKEEIAIEVKFNEETKDINFFEQSPFKNKILIRNYEDLLKLRG